MHKRSLSPSPSQNMKPAGMRIAKAIARAGICSRREAERLIEEGSVKVNGKVLKSPAFNVGEDDHVTVRGKPLPDAEPIRLWRYHKPKGLITSHQDPEERKTIFETLPDGLPRVISVGRLDLSTEGLLLLTNDGGLARYLELPQTGWTRKYRVRAFGKISQDRLDRLRSGCEVDGVRYGPAEATLDKIQGTNVWITIAIKEGKNREVKRLMESLDLKVNRLIRLSYGPFVLGNMKTGQVVEIKRSVIVSQIGEKAAQELGFKAPVSKKNKNETS